MRHITDQVLEQSHATKKSFFTLLALISKLPKDDVDKIEDEMFAGMYDGALEGIKTAPIARLNKVVSALEEILKICKVEIEGRNS